MRVPAPCVLLLAALVAGAPRPLGAAGEEREYPLRVVPLEANPTTQRTDLRTVRTLGDAIPLGTATFPVLSRERGLRVGVSPDGKRTATVRAGKPVEFRWSEGEERRTVRLCFEESGEGTWTYAGAEAVEADVEGTPLRIFDLDLDGRYDGFGSDGIAAHGGSVALPLEREFPHGRHRVTILSVDAAKGWIRARVEPLEGNEAQLAVLAGINDLRVSHGLPPVGLDPALSRGCCAHARYLRVWGWTGTTDPHVQDHGPDAVSEEGAAAARRSVIARAPGTVALDWYWRSWYHRIGLMSPGLSRVGIDDGREGISIVDVGQRFDAERDEALQKAWPWQDPVVVPADGATGVPLQSSPEMLGEPVPDLGSRGFPVMAVFRYRFLDLGEVTATLEEESRGKWIPVPFLYPERKKYPYVVGLVPARPLKPATRYRARLEIEHFPEIEPPPGVEQVREVIVRTTTFRTR